MREGLRLLIERHDDIVVQAHVATVAEAVALDVVPDVVVTDLDLPDARGAQVITALRRRFTDSSVLILTLVRHPARIQAAAVAGAHGYLLRTADPTDLVVGIRAVVRGETYLQPSLGVAVARWIGMTTDDGSAGGRLSAKEAEVLRLIALGHTNAEMAEQLSMSLRTVETHRGRLMHKLGGRSRAELVRYAFEAGLVDLR